MGCDVESNRRRRLWEKDLAALAAETAGIGWRGSDLTSRQYWLKLDDIQTGADVVWLNSGVLLDNVTPDFPFTGQWYFSQVTGWRVLRLGLQGFPLGTAGPGGPPASLIGTMEISYSTALDFPVITIHVAQILLLSPFVTDVISIPSFTQTHGPVDDDHTISGGATITPLDRCHNCFM
jgi:hypothetical protein